jgi:hypothetical protein
MLIMIWGEALEECSKRVGETVTSTQRGVKAQTKADYYPALPPSPRAQRCKWLSIEVEDL